jgi:flagellin
MGDLATKYQATTDTQEQAEYAAEFKSLRDTVVTALDNAKVDGVNIADGTYNQTVAMDPNGGSLAVDLSGANNFVTSANLSALDLSTGAAAAATAVTTETTNSLNYMNTAKGLDATIENQISLNKTIVNSKEAVKSLITDIDEAAEMSKMLDQNVRQQAAMSMLSQANMSRQVVMKLY